MHLQVMFKAGMFPIVTVAEPGVHGAVVTGRHGIGVNTPKAALVAAATMGFAIDMHITNGGIFSMGMCSMMVAAGGPPAMVRLVGNTFKALGAAPNEHIIMVPVLAMGGMV